MIAGKAIRQCFLLPFGNDSSSALQKTESCRGSHFPSLGTWNILPLRIPPSTALLVASANVSAGSSSDSSPTPVSPGSSTVSSWRHHGAGQQGGEPGKSLSLWYSPTKTGGGFVIAGHQLWKMRQIFVTPAKPNRQQCKPFPLQPPEGSFLSKCLAL